MNRFKYLFLSLSLSLLPTYGETDTAEAVPPVRAEDFTTLQSKGYTPLLDQNSLEGWQVLGSMTDFSIKDGVLKGHGHELKGSSYLCHEKEYGDFIFAFQMKFDHLKGNSGVMFRAKLNGGKHPYGYQCEHDNKVKRSWTAGLFDQSRRGWLYPFRINKKSKTPVTLDPAAAAAASEFQKAFTEQGQRIFKEDDWNTIIIKCKGNHVRTWLNGELRVNFHDTDPEHTTLKGIFGFQVHGGKSCDVRWRNIFVKELE